MRTFYIKQNDGYIISPSFPNNYGNNNQVTWHITVSPTYAVLMTVSYFLTESGRDYVMFYDGSTNADYNLITR